jgi:hypothetical protein
LIVYKSLPVSVLTHASLCCGYAAEIHVDKLQIFQHKILRIITTAFPVVPPIKILHEETQMALIKTHQRASTVHKQQRLINVT